VVVSCDSHIGPSQSHVLRPYCESRYLRLFDEDVEETRPVGNIGVDPGSVGFENFCRNSRSRAGLERWDKHTMYEGAQDPYVRLRNMDEDGVAASVIFHDTINADYLNQLPADEPARLQPPGPQTLIRWLHDEGWQLIPTGVDKPPVE
jgi:hypothetical protein